MIAHPHRSNRLGSVLTLISIIGLTFLLCLPSIADAAVKPPKKSGTSYTADSTLKAILITNADGSRYSITDAKTEDFNTILSHISYINLMRKIKGEEAATYGARDGQYVLEIRLPSVLKVVIDGNKVVTANSTIRIAPNSGAELKEEPSVAKIEDKDTPFMTIDEEPKFKGKDINAFKHWVAYRLVYPTLAAEKNITGRVTLSFIVGSDGYVSDVTIIKGVHPLLDAEAASVVQSSPRWSAGISEGKKVSFIYTMPVEFTLEP